MTVLRAVGCVLAALSLGASIAHANPTGASVISGSTTISQQGSLLSVSSTPNAIVSWSSFQVGASEATRYQQQDSASSILNRVTGFDPSHIDGVLQSNAVVGINSRSGIVIGSGARIDVAGLLLSTGQVSDTQFLSGSYPFDPLQVLTPVANHGEIKATGGAVTIIGSRIVNEGSIRSTSGGITLVGDLVNNGLIDAGAGRLTVLGSSYQGSGTLQGREAFIDLLDPIDTGSEIITPGVLVLASTSTLALEIGSAGAVSNASPLAAGVIVLQGGNLTIRANETFDPSTGNRYPILGGMLSLTGRFHAISLPVIHAAGVRWDTSNLYLDGTIAIVAVPEPSVRAMIIAGLAIVVFAARRRLVGHA